MLNQRCGEGPCALGWDLCDGGPAGGLIQSSGHPDRSLPLRGWQSWPHAPSSSGWAPQALPGRGHRAGGRVAAVLKGCPGHLCGVWDLQVGLALDGVARGPGCPNGDDLTVEAAPFSRSWLSRRLDHQAKPGMGFCWELLIGLTGTGPEKDQMPPASRDTAGQQRSVTGSW